ncbi:MAG: hypothetical protein R3F13_20665 [Prosthecobacter sp.]
MNGKNIMEPQGGEGSCDGKVKEMITTPRQFYRTAAMSLPNQQAPTQAAMRVVWQGMRGKLADYLLPLDAEKGRMVG